MILYCIDKYLQITIQIFTKHDIHNITNLNSCS